jgi:2'-hydroxyisoflavone reductase
MRLLVLGGTRFPRDGISSILALARGDDVTVFTRGKQPNHWPGRVTALEGNRDQANSPGLRALEEGTWDAVARHERLRAAASCGNRRSSWRHAVGRYLFVSSISVFTDASRAGLTEKDPVGLLDDPKTEEIGKYYGPLKAACERVVSDVYGYRALNVRPGLIVGPHDPTDRFGYWSRDSRSRVARRARGRGGRSQSALAADPADRRARPRGLHARAPGQGPRRDAQRDESGGAVDDGRDDRCAVRSRRCSGACPRWIDEEILIEHKVDPWTGLPLWIPLSFADEAGFMQIDCTKAERAGLRTRPLRDTIRDTAAWLAQRDNAGAWRDAIGADREREVLDAAR